MNTFNKKPPKFLRDTINRYRKKIGLPPLKTRVEKIIAIKEKLKSLKENE